MVDAEGNAVSCTQSLGGFGCGVVVPDTGILLNDFIYWFDHDADSPNVVGPHKKVEMCLSPGMIWQGRQGLRLHGHAGQPRHHGNHPAIHVQPDGLRHVGPGRHRGAPRPPQESARIIAEGRIATDVLAGLAKRGHLVDRQPDFSMAFGGAQGIMIDPDTGTFSGGADPRRDGYAIGW